MPKKAGETPFDIQVRSRRVGRDYLFTVTGGEAHIGAVATVFPDGEGVRTELSVVPGHREDLLARELAELACIRLRSTVTLTAGIHIDQATKADIELAVRTARDELIRHLDELDLEAT
jgi:hypothetical protein